MQITRDVVGRSVDNRHTKILVRCLVVWTAESTDKIEIHHAPDKIAFAELVVHFSIAAFRNHLNDIGGLCDSFISIIPEVLQTVVVWCARVRDKLVEGIRGRSSDHDVVAGVFAQSVHRV